MSCKVKKKLRVGHRDESFRTFLYRYRCLSSKKSLSVVQKIDKHFTVVNHSIKTMT